MTPNPTPARCRMCGGEARDKPITYTDPGTTWWRIECGSVRRIDCGVLGPWAKSYESATELWNTLQSPPLPERWVAVPRVATWRHKKRGTTYTEIGHANVQADAPINEGDEVVVYLAEDGEFWARPLFEFFDGRFEKIAAPPRPQQKETL